MRKVLVVLSAVLVSAVSASGATPTVTPAPPAKVAPGTPAPSPTHITEWEYLVVSFGKTYFSWPLNASEKQLGLSKLRAFSDAGILVAAAQEATSTQAQMDALGRYGWELVGVLGAIGGDQQMVFKRPFDAERSAKEAALIAEEGRRLAQAEKEVEVQPTDALVDLDAAEAQAADAQRGQAIRGAISTLQHDYEVADVEVRPLESRPGTMIVQVTIDGTSPLVKVAGKYRKSEAVALATKFIGELLGPANLTTDMLEGFSPPAEVLVYVHVAITHSGRRQVVDRETQLFYRKR